MLSVVKIGTHAQGALSTARGPLSVRTENTFGDPGCLKPWNTLSLCLKESNKLSVWGLSKLKIKFTNILRIQLKLNTALLSTVRPCVRSCVTGVTSHIFHIYKGINAMLIIRGPIKPYIFWIKSILAIFLAKIRPDKTIFSALTNMTIDFDFELSKI